MVDESELSDADRIASLEAEAILRDARIAELVAEVDRLISGRAHAALIEQAKGVIMSETRCSAEAAFAALVAISQRENVKLRAVAERIAGEQNLRG